MKLSYLAGAVLALGASSAMAYDCNDVSFVSATYYDCQGSFAPPPNDSVAAVNALTFTPDITVAFGYKDNIQDVEIGSDVPQIDFSAGGNGAGSLTFGAGLTDPFVIVLKFGQEWSAYAFTQDVVAGETWTFSGGPTSGGGLSHGTLYTSNELIPGPIPEPSTYALMLAGLGAVGLVARRRRSPK